MRHPTPATFSHPDWMRAISAQLPGATHVKVPASGLPRLSATLRKMRWPFAYYDSWLTPLTPTGLASATLPPSAQDALALLDATETPILFRNMPLHHPVTQELLATAAHQHVVKRWQRAGLELAGSFDDWLMQNFDQKRRKELKRLRARLGEQGKLESRSLKQGDDLYPFLQAFLTLEAKGWKGKRGTAVAADGQLVRALTEGLGVMHSQGRLKFWQIDLDDQPIAALYALVDDGEVALGKIAHDESFAKYSPGVLIILDATASMMGQADLQRADSYAIPDHPMIDRIWRDRIDCIDVLLAGPSTPTPVFQALTFFIGTKTALRNTAKRVLAQATGRKIS